NSLLEGMVVGGRAGQAAAAHAAEVGQSRATAPEPIVHTAPRRRELQRAMSRNASVVRNAVGLQELSDSLTEAGTRQSGGRRDFEDVALTLVARALTAAALARNESRGCHHRGEFPNPAPDQARSIMVRLADDQNHVCAEALASVC